VLRNLRRQQVPGKPWLSFEAVRTRLEVSTGDALAETPLRKPLRPEVGESREAMQGKADETERLRAWTGEAWRHRRRQFSSETKILTGIVCGRVWLGASSLCQNRDGVNSVSPQMCGCAKCGSDAAGRVWEWQECLLLISW